MSMFGIDLRNSLRIGFACLAGASLIASMPTEASAKHLKHVAHHRSHKQVETVQTASDTGSNLGPMRYYGGPKSPMWREVGVQTASAQATSSNSGGMRYYGGPKSPMWRQ
jgi:hypothetical protein